ncbi:MAG: HEAT repeat domain-containing protein, partial [Candidatus Anstonellales archaeon]
GGDCSAAVPGLIDALKDEWVRVNAVMALGEIGDERAVPGLIDALKDKNWLVRWRASEALGKIAKKGQDISSAIEALKNVADNDEYPLVREAAREALRAAGVE